MILAIDTTSEFGSLALARGDEIVDVVPLRSRDGYGHIVFQAIQDLLGRHAFKLSDIEGYAAASGPGSFTGVRIALTAAKGLAEAHGRRVVPVSNLKALAYAGTGGLRAPVIDARRGEIYCAVYNSDLQLVMEESVEPPERFLARIGGRQVSFVSTSPIPGLEAAIVPRELAAPIACVAARVFAAGLALLPEEVEANYVRRPDAVAGT